MSLITASSNSPRIECRLLTGAVALECAVLADGVGSLEDPVLPGGKSGEDFRFHRLRAAEAQIRLEAGEAVGRKARAFLEEHANLVFPIDVVEREGNETELLSRLRVEHLAHCAFGALERGGLGKETARQPGNPVRHRVSAEIDLGQRKRRGRLVIAVA